MGTTEATINSLRTESASQDIESDLDPTLVDPQEAITKAEQDMNFLGALCFAEHMKYLFPEMFLIMWELLKSKVHLVRDFSKIALGIPRGFAKTTFIKVLLIYIILFTKKNFVLIVSYNEDHAISIIKDVCTMLSSNNIMALFGNWEVNREINRADLKIFTFRGRKIILKAVGAKGGIRGLNHEHYRPDVMIFEDYQTKTESENDELSKKLYEDMIGTAMKANSPFGCLYIYVGNMYATPGAILKKLKNNPDWVSLVVGAITENEESLWEELQPLEQLLAEYQSDLNADCPQIFLAEKLNDENAGIKAGIDITKLPQCPYEEDDIPDGRAVVIDPALDNPNSDYNGIGLIGVFDEIPVVEKIILGKFNPFDLIKKALILAFESNCRLICVENVAYQASLLFWFNKVCLDNGIEGFIFMPLKIGGGTKNAKILESLREWVGSKTHVKKRVRAMILNEVIKFIPNKNNKQDTCLDILTFAKKVIEQHGHLMLMPHAVEEMTNPNAAPREIEDNCVF